ncbi:MAG TPA: hypothetical protein VG984_00970 [Candidatus Paceibacterota bacterium]|nr:hypothetical protein [Candidatus Paceibacterota bacterium]
MGWASLGFQDSSFEQWELTMSQGMLGFLPLSQVQGPRNSLDQRLAGKNGSIWLKRLNHMLREQMTIVYGDGQTKEELLAQVEKDWDVEPEARAFILSEQFRMASEPGECDFTTAKQSYAVHYSEGLEMLRKGLCQPPYEEDALRFAALYPRGVTRPAAFLHMDNLWKDKYVLTLWGAYPAGGQPKPLMQCVDLYEPTGRNIHSEWYSSQWRPSMNFVGRKDYENHCY